MQRKKYKTIAEFIADAPKESRGYLKSLREIIGKVIHKADAAISYNIPCYKVNGKTIVYFAGYQKHVSIYPIPKDINGIKDGIAKYKQGKGTLRFPLDEPLPTAFIKKVVQKLTKGKLDRAKK